MRVAGLFAGIGGFELGLQRAGHHAVLLCDIHEGAKAVLEERFPGIRLASDVRKLESLGRDIEVLCAGFPCQDLSQAGRTKGLSGDQSGLVSEVFRLLEKRKAARHAVPWVVIENVPFMLQLHGGAAMRAIIAKLEDLGYRWAYRVVDTFSFGLPQRRERVFLVASRAGDPWDVLLSDDNTLQRPETALGTLAHGFYWTEGLGGLGWAVDAVPTLKNGSTIGIPSQPAVLMPGGAVIKPDIRDAERMQGFDTDWTVPAEQVARPSTRWSLVGSAVSAPVSEWIGRRLVEPGTYSRGRDLPFPQAGKLPRAARFDGKTRFAVSIGTDPIGVRPAHLTDFLRFPGHPLSLKAASGFLGRTRRAKLKFAPGFIDAIERYVGALGGDIPPPRIPSRPPEPALLAD